MYVHAARDGAEHVLARSRAKLSPKPSQAQLGHLTGGQTPCEVTTTKITRKSCNFRLFNLSWHCHYKLFFDSDILFDVRGDVKISLTVGKNIFHHK